MSQAVEKATGLRLNFIDVQKEVSLNISGLIPLKYRNKSVLIDVGSGSTRGGYREADGEYVTFGDVPGVIPFRTKVEARAAGRLFAEVAAKMAAVELNKPLAQVLERKAELINRERVYLNGGAVWILTTFQRPQDRKRFVRLTAQDIDNFYALIHRRPTEFPRFQLPHDLDPKARADVERDLAKMRDRFKPEWLVAASELLKAISAEFHLASKEVYFTREAGEIGWLLAYISERGIAAQ